LPFDASRVQGMGYVRLNDDAIWVRSIDGDDALREAILRLRAGEQLALDVDGNVGLWQKMRDGKDGRPTHGIRPIGPMRDIWRSMQDRRGDWVPISQAKHDPYLAMIDKLLSEEWDSPEDDEAYRDLPIR
jgi:hypothetical protein